MKSMEGLPTLFKPVVRAILASLLLAQPATLRAADLGADGPPGAKSPDARKQPPVASLAPYDFGNEPMRYLENARLKLGINLQAGGAVTYLEDKQLKSGNMINSSDWGRQIQLSYYSGPVPFIGPNGEKPTPEWAGLGWNPIQAGSVGRIASKTIAFEHGPDFLRARCVPMQWPHPNLPAECVFEATYRLVGGNAILMEARIINQRADHTQYPARHQEMPALYTNGPWYRLVTYIGDHPRSGAVLATVVGKDDNKGWPWETFYAPEHWAALVNDGGTGVGLFQPDTCTMTGGFSGGDPLKGKGGPTDGQTGYLSPIARRILDHNMDWTYRTHIIVGSLDEIRDYARKQPPQRVSWEFASDRLGWVYENGKDAGWPIHDGLKVTYQKVPIGAMVSDAIYWAAEEAPVLEIEASFESGSGELELRSELVIQPFGLAERTDFPAWEPQDASQRAANETRHKDFPPAPAIVIPFPVQGDGKMHIYALKLSENPNYHGAMRQLRLNFPATDGSADVRRISLLRRP
ncbi:MAG: hypothetical protein WCJ66_06305 [Verrucomicrobiota bacterium]